MATINQLSKQIETANKRLADYTRKVDMYRERVNKYCTAAGISADDIVTTEYRPYFYDYDLPQEVRDSIGYETAYRITDNYRSMKTNEHHAAVEQRNIERLATELAKIQESEDAKRNAFDNDLAAALENAMQDFKKVWFEKMMNWYKAHHEYINAKKDIARANYRRVHPLCYYFKYTRNHHRLFANLNIYERNQTSIFTDNAARMSLEDYLNDCHKYLTAQWSKGIETLTEKCSNYGIDQSKMEIALPAMTEKGFEVYVKDGKPRRIYARVIWAAEDSLIITPHTRYIVTEKKTK